MGCFPGRCPGGLSRRSLNEHPEPKQDDATVGRAPLAAWAPNGAITPPPGALTRHEPLLVAGADFDNLDNPLHPPEPAAPDDMVDRPGRLAGPVPDTSLVCLARRRARRHTELTSSTPQSDRRNDGHHESAHLSRQAQGPRVHRCGTCNATNAIALNSSTTPVDGKPGSPEEGSDCWCGPTSAARPSPRRILRAHRSPGR